jgi:hypothetical protein
VTGPSFLLHLKHFELSEAGMAGDDLTSSIIFGIEDRISDGSVWDDEDWLSLKHFEQRPSLQPKKILQFRQIGGSIYIEYSSGFLPLSIGFRK